MSRLVSWATGHPVDLAVFRIVVCITVLLSVDVWTAAQWAAATPQAPDGWVLASRLLPATVWAAQLATMVLAAAVALTLVGLFTQLSSVIAACAALWLLGVPQQSGQVMHTHHLVWFLALIAAGPSGDALSLDRWRRARSGEAAPGPSLAHGVPLRAAWLSVGLIFFFPGLWKALAGSAWLDGLPALVEWKWFQLGGAPSFTPSPQLLWWGGALAIAFELGFIGLIISSRTRLLGALLAVLFHLGVQLVLGIVFSSLWVCYAMFLPWAHWAAAKEDGAPTPKRRVLAPLLVGVLLLGAQLVTGVLGREDTWPVAAYPSFRYPAPQVIAWLEVEEVDSTGPQLTLSRLEGGAAQRRWGVMTQLLRDPSSERLRAFYLDWRGAIPPGVSELRYFVVTRRLGAPSAPIRKRLGAERDLMAPPVTDFRQ